MAERNGDAAEIGKRAAEEVLGAKPLGDQMREAAEAVLQAQRDRVASAVRGVAELLRGAGERLESERKPIAATYAARAAMHVDRLAEGVRSRSLSELGDGLRRLARRRPALFLAGALAGGFVAVRVLTQSSRRESGARGYAMTGGEHSPHSDARPDAVAKPADRAAVAAKSP
jgi:hypothetical protein